MESMPTNEQHGMGLGLRCDVLPCPVCARYTCRCRGELDATPDALEPSEDWTPMTVWCQAAAANA
jgi:hypothetical protein